MTPTWNESLKIGIPLLDFQHQQLLDQMDILVAGLEKKKEQQELKSILVFLDMYVKNHFKYEESCMELYQCPVACKNKDAHAYFLANLQEINQNIERNVELELIIIQVKRQLLEWFVNHIKSIDTKLEAYVKK